jgi:serine/threonine protein kinase
MALCTVSDKHAVCRDCCRGLLLCPLCDGTLVTTIPIAQSMIDAIKEARKKLEDYCFPSDLATQITIKSNQQPIAHGAMGKLFNVNNTYAVKCALIANTIDTEDALIHEIAVSRPLAHIPSLVAVYGGVRLSQHGISIVMEYINGPSLAAALADSSTIIRNLSIRERLKIALGIAQGLGELHLAKLVHRDFKPENVLLSQSSNGIYVPKTANFGVSFQLSIASATFVRESGGTVGYDASEVAVHNKIPSAASDRYALAFTIYELLTATRIFTGLRPAQILTKFTINGERPRICPNAIATSLKDVIERAWSVEPDQRATIGEVIHAIRESLDRNQLSCIEMLREANALRKNIASVQLENFKSFELFALNEFVKRMLIDDCEAMQMFIDQLPPSL